MIINEVRPYGLIVLSLRRIGSYAANEYSRKLCEQPCLHTRGK